MKLTITTQVSVDGVMQGNGPSEPDREAGFERDGWAITGHFGDESGALNLLTVPAVVGQGTRLFPADGPDLALDLVESRAFRKGVTLQVYRPVGRPRYGLAGA
ncbi:MAG: hypothetical protein ACJ786_40090 [Catenulispora sp.]